MPVETERQRPPLTAAEQKVIIERMNPILQARCGQLGTNILGIKGGQAYIDARLSRFAGESKISWEGGVRQDGSEVTGRKNQAHCIPYLSRIANKINQYLFSEAPRRDALAPEIADNITRDGTTMAEFFNTVNDYLTSCGWCWIGIDAPNVENPRTVSIQFKEKNNLRPYWNVYSPLDVVDWAFDDRGKLLWVLTAGAESNNISALSKPSRRRYRMLWEPGLVRKFYISESGDKIEAMAEFPIQLQEAPFVLVGRPALDPHVFDSLESVNRTIMDLGSCNRQNFFDAVFPQLCIPASVIARAAEILQTTQERAVEMTVGFNFPIVIGEGDPTPSYITPDTTGFAEMRNEIIELRYALFETAGLLPKIDSKQMQSAESKAWDYLELEQLLKHRALTLQSAERKAVQISNAWDNNFPNYQPEYNLRFDVENFVQDIQAIVMASQVSMPDEMTRVLLGKLFKAVRRIGGDELAPAEIKTVLEAIENYTALRSLPFGFESTEEEEEEE